MKYLDTLSRIVYAEHSLRPTPHLREYLNILGCFQQQFNQDHDSAQLVKEHLVSHWPSFLPQVSSFPQLNTLLFFYSNNNVLLSQSQGALLSPLLNLIPHISHPSTRFLTMVDLSKNLLLCVDCSPRLVNSVLDRMHHLALPRDTRLSYDQNRFF